MNHKEWNILPTMKKTLLFATDLDGTLLRSDGSFSSQDLNSLRLLRDSGCIVVLATGRSPLSLKKCLNGRELPVDWYVLSSGAGILDNRWNVSFSKSLSASHTLQIYNAFIEAGITDISIQGVFPDAHILFWMEGLFCLDFRKRLAYYREFSKKIDNPEIPATEVIGFVSPEEADSVIFELEKTIGKDFSIIRATSPIDHKTVWIEVFAKGVNKASACDVVRNQFHISKQNTAAVGNDWNDIQMLRWAHSSYITANAPEPLLHEFTKVPSNELNGVTVAVNHWLKTL